MVGLFLNDSKIIDNFVNLSIDPKNYKFKFDKIKSLFVYHVANI